MRYECSSENLCLESREPVHLVSFFYTYPCQSILHWWNLYIPVRYSVTLRNVLLRSTKNSLKINQKSCFILERLYESCTDGHGLLGHIWNTRIMSSCRNGNDCTVECDTVWSYHSRIKVKQVFVTLKINKQLPFCGNVKESMC